MDEVELDSLKEDAEDYLQSMRQLAQTEKDLVDEYNNGDYSDFADDQADITGDSNDMSREAEDMADDVDETPGMEDPGSSDYDLAEYIINFCDQHSQE